MRNHNTMIVWPGSMRVRLEGWFGSRRSVYWNKFTTLAVVGMVAGIVWGCTHKPFVSVEHIPFKHELVKPTCERIITAEVVALEQVYYYNRFGSFNPAGIMYALRRDVVSEDIQDTAEPQAGMYERKPRKLEVKNSDLDEWESEGEPIPQYSKEKEANDRKLAGHVKLRSDKRPRPLVLRANEGDCLQVTFTNLLSPNGDGAEVINDPAFRLTNPQQVLDGKDKKDPKPIKDVLDSDEPATRHASMHVNGLSLVDSIDSQGANVGQNEWYWYKTDENKQYVLDKDRNRIKVKMDGKCSSNPIDFGKNLCALAAPGETRVFTWYAKKEGTYFFYSMGAPAGGEGDGGQLGLGLFGAVNVQPKGAKWYRSQVTYDEMKKSTVTTTPNYGQPVINYEAVSHTGIPVLNMLKLTREKTSRPVEANRGNRTPCATNEYQYEHEENPSDGMVKWTCEKPPIYEIVHSDLNAVIDIQSEKNCEQQGEGSACGKPYREFTVIFHDEVTAVQAFEELDNENSGVSSLRDGMGINYGASGLGPMVIANRKKIGPSRDCVECKLEEFFLTSWVHGDPAMVVGYRRDSQGNLIPDCGNAEAGACNEHGVKHLTSPVIMPNGNIFKRRPNGDVGVTGPKGTSDRIQLEGTIFKRLSNGTTFKHLGDGSTDMIRLEDTIFKRRLDGSVEEIREDETSSSIHLEATVYKRLSDGVTFRYLADGTIDKIQGGKSSKPVTGEVTFTFPYLYKKEAKYSDDPSNVHHSYLGDPVRFRNMHAGPKETHVFHLHAHQWVEDKHDPSSHYLDSQTISPGSTFSYDVHYGGSGNRNLGPGDSIFHCHLYPHFAQGMWELWRTHDVFEDGTTGFESGKIGGVFDPQKPVDDLTNNPRWRNLPDAEIEGGTPNPAIVPLPRTPLPPMSSDKFAGYPFYIAGEKGHRPPQPPLDLDGYEKDEAKRNEIRKQTLRRHIIVGGTAKDGINADEPEQIIGDVQKNIKEQSKDVADRSKGSKEENPKYHKPTLYPDGNFAIPERQTKHASPLLYENGKDLSDYTARRVFRDNQNRDFFGLARQLESVHIKSLEEAGEPQESAAMQFHAGKLLLGNGDPAMKPGDHGWTHTNYNWDAPGYKTCRIELGSPKGFICDQDESGQPILFRVSGLGKRDDGNHKKDNPQKNNGEQHEEVTSAKTDFGMPGAPFANPCPTHFVDENGRVRDVETRKYKAAYIQMDMTVNKAGWHDPQARFPVLEGDVKRTLNGERQTEPLFFRANSGECIEFKATNLIPSNLNLDDFQVYSPTDTIGQHIHLVKFDVTSSDGSGNGWNYEDGTLAADEVRERIIANNAFVKLCKEHPENSLCPTDPEAKKKLSLLKPKTHPIFLKKGELGAKEDGALAGDTRGQCSDITKKEADNHDPKEHPWCGAQTTIQRWWADPLLNGKPGDKEREGEDRSRYKAKNVKDRTLRTVFTHDHFGPSSHQHHGFYAALVVEPRNSKWYFLNGQQMGGVDEDSVPFRVNGRNDGGPTSYAANIIVRDEGKACLNLTTIECSQQLDHKASIDRRRTGREFNLAFADFAIVYTADSKKADEPEANRLRPVNPPSHGEGGVQTPVIPSRIPLPEGISTKDPGTQLINYRNEPIPLRIGEWKMFGPDDPKDNDEVKKFDWMTAVSSPWSCLPTQGEPNKKSCFVQKDGSVGDMAHVFSSQVHKLISQNGKEVPDERGHSIFTEHLANGEGRKNLVGRQPGDPATPLLQAYDGDRVQIRLIQGAQEEQHVFTMHGARWLSQPDSPDSGYVNAQHIGISEHFEFNDRMLGLSELPVAELGQGFKTKPCKAESTEGKSEPCRTDLLFSSSAIDNLWDGQWGLMRVYPATENLNHVLAPLPGNLNKNPFDSVFRDPEFDEQIESNNDGPEVMKATVKEVADPVEAFCADPAREKFVKKFSVEAWMAKDLLGEKGLVYNKKFGIADPDAILFVKQSHVFAIRNGTQKPEPLILRARAGDCIEVTLTNMLPKTMPDDPKLPGWQTTWSYNMLPPIVEGFNFNQLRSSNRVGLHAGLVDQNTRLHDGAHVGFNDDSTVEPEDEVTRKTGQYKKSKTYRWYAGDLTVRKQKMIGTPIEFGVIPLTDQADVIKHPAHGAIGALVIEPQCSEFTTERVKDGDAYIESDAVASVTWWESVRETDENGRLTKAFRCPDKPKEGMSKSVSKGFDTALAPSSWFKTSEERFDGLQRFKEFVLLYQDALALQQYGQPIPNLRNGDDSEDSGQKAFNYRTEPLWARLGGSAADEPDVMNEYDWSNVLSSTVGCPTRDCDPETPLFKVPAGELVRFRVAHPGGHPRMHALAIFGHDWALNPWANKSRTMGYNSDSPTRFGSTNGIGPARHLNIVTRAGGDCAVKGDYLYRTQEGFMFGGGLWGILRIDPEEQSYTTKNPNACKVKLPGDNAK